MAVGMLDLRYLSVVALTGINDFSLLETYPAFCPCIGGSNDVIYSGTRAFVSLYINM